MALNFQIPSFEQANPLLMGVQFGQGLHKNFIENQNLPEKLKAALLHQQLMNENQQTANQFQAPTLQEQLTHLQQQNQFYPQIQQANIAHTKAGTSNLHSLINQRNQANAPGGMNELEKQMMQAKLALLQRQSSPEYMQQAQEDEQRDREYKQEMLESARVRRKMATGELPSRVIQNQLQQAQLGMSDIAESIPDIIKGQIGYLGASGPSKRLWESGRSSLGIAEQDEKDRVENYNASQDLITLAAEKMMRYGLLPRIKKSYEDVRKIFEPRYVLGVPESPQSYEKRINRELQSVYKKYKQNQMTMEKGFKKSIENESDIESEPEIQEGW